MFAAVAAVHRRCRGGYAAVAMLVGHGVLAFRDPLRHPPLVVGYRGEGSPARVHGRLRERGPGRAGLRLLGDVAPGEAVFIDSKRQLHMQQCAENPVLRPCIFEHVYFARPDSLIDEISVYKTRKRVRARRWRARSCASARSTISTWSSRCRTEPHRGPGPGADLGIKYREAFIKNRYIGRTFIMPGQQQRRKSVRQKLNPIRLEFEGKNVMLVDDSIVRGTTSREIIQMARDAGRPARIPGLGGAAGALPERLRHRYAVASGADRPRAQRRRRSANSSAPTGWSTRTSTSWCAAPPRATRTVEASSARCSTASTSPVMWTRAYLEHWSGAQRRGPEPQRDSASMATVSWSASTTKCPKPAEQARQIGKPCPGVVFSSPIL
jgi:hypothetical protein